MHIFLKSNGDKSFKKLNLFNIDAIFPFPLEKKKDVVSTYHTGFEHCTFIISN